MRHSTSALCAEHFEVRIIIYTPPLSRRFGKIGAATRHKRKFIFGVELSVAINRPRQELVPENETFRVANYRQQDEILTYHKHCSKFISQTQVWIRSYSEKYGACVNEYFL